MAGIIITPGLSERAFQRTPDDPNVGQQPPAASRHGHMSDRRSAVLPGLFAVLLMAAAFAAIGAQLFRLAWEGQEAGVRIAISEPIATAFSRPDIVDRHGRLLASDVVMPSLIADPSVVLDAREIVTELAEVLPGLDAERVLTALGDRSKQFAWVRRGLSPAEAERVHNLGLPGLSFRDELRRAYPLRRVAGHVLGHVDIDNKGLAGIENYLDRLKEVEPVHGTSLSAQPAVQLSLDVAVQFAVEEELQLAIERYGAKAATGIVLDVDTGEILAAASLPGVDPVAADERFETRRMDRLSGGVYELGSVFKAMTVAMAIDAGEGIDAGTAVDVRQQLVVDGYSIRDLHPAGRPLSVAEIFLKSSNVGAGLLALGLGGERQKAFLEKLGLKPDLWTEAGAIAAPKLPERWGDVETVTVAYGHGLAVSPMQFAVASAALVNGGFRVEPTFLRQSDRGVREDRERVLKPETSAAIRDMMHLNVAGDQGTGRRARVNGVSVGGKTGTAEIAGVGGYQEKAVIASFLGAFPMERPRYLSLVSLFEPKGTAASDGEITAGRNAAPTTARIVERIAPLLGVTAAGALEQLTAFDAAGGGQ